MAEIHLQSEHQLVFGPILASYSLVETLMRSMIVATLTGGIVILGGCAQEGRQSADRSGADTQTRAELRNAKGEPAGSATFTDTGSGVEIAVDVNGIPAGQHGIHVHQVGRCDPPDFESAGDHFNPGAKQHGSENPQGKHAGDLGNIEVAADGRGSMRMLSADLSLGAAENSLLRGQGTSLVVHSDPDDHKTDPSGNTGARVACGAIEKH
jgi:Cu-Zn family superoxide dismutase